MCKNSDTDFACHCTEWAKAGLAQGSPLSPILFDFFNSDLVDQPVDFKGGASAFIDDYFRWRVGKTAEENIRKIQEEDIPRVEAWARRTGARFSIAKTELIHLTRKKKEVGAGSITFEGTTINATPTAKLLGIVFDPELRWKHQVQQALKRASKAVSALSGLRHLRPFQMRQLYITCVVPVIDYASTVWHNPLKDKTHLRTLNTIQRDVLIRILSAFRTTATQAMEMEAYVPPTRLRLKRRGRDVVASLFTQPKDHPIHGVLERASRRAVAKGDAARLPIAQVIKTMDTTKLRMLETLDPRPLEPWKPPSPTKNHESRKPLVALKREHREDMIREWQQEWQVSKNGQYLKRIHEGLPSKRALRLHDGMSRYETYFFTQLRLGHNWLKSSAKARRLSDDDKCECGAIETVVHVIVDCPKLCVIRKELRAKVGDSFNSVAWMLGGRQKNARGKETQWPINRAVLKAVIEFAEKSQRFCSRTSQRYVAASQQG